MREFLLCVYIWTFVQRKLNALYEWYKDFYAAMLESKVHVNGMHVAPEEGGEAVEGKQEEVGEMNGEGAVAVELPETGDVELEPLLEQNLAAELNNE
jgi:hypothetical protein